MLFHVQMTVRLPHDMPAEQATDLKAREKAIAQGLQREGTWRHLWRIAGRYANVSVFDVPDNAALHDTLMKLPAVPLHGDRGAAAVPPRFLHPRRRPLTLPLPQPTNPTETTPCRTNSPKPNCSIA